MRFSIGSASLMEWAKRIKPRLTANKPTIKIDMRVLWLDIEKYPDTYQYECARRLGVSTRGICHALKRGGFRYKNISASQSRS